MKAGGRRAATERVGPQRLVLVLALVIAGGCGAGDTERDVSGGDAPDAPPADASVAATATGGQACVPVEGALSSDASLSGMPGSYRLTLATSDTPPVSTEGSLVLEPLPEALQEMAGAATPLGGTADIDVEAVGALRLGDLGSADPAAPGVLVIESPGPSVLLRFGSDPAPMRSWLDGGTWHIVMTVQYAGAAWPLQIDISQPGSPP